jgi:hypothetical protein
MSGVWKALAMSIATATLAVGAGCGGGDEDEPAAGAKPAETPQTFVGITEGSDEIVAVTLAGDGRAEAYVCDGEEVGEFFEGQIEDGRLRLTSARGAQLEATVGGDRAEGTFRSADGEDLTFQASLNDEAGIYLIEVSADGSMAGQSAGEGRFDLEPTSSGVKGTASYPSGEELTLNGRVVTGQEIPVDDLRGKLVSGEEIDVPGPRHTFSFYSGGKPRTPQGSFKEFAGPYRFVLFDRIMVGGSTPDNPQPDQILINCYPAA